jgi:ATP-dependent Clp protease ATP-binding subunit ClpB
VTTVDLYPEWAREVYARLAVSPQLVIAGNVDDFHLAPHPVEGTPILRTTVDVLGQILRHSGYDVVLCWNVVAGLTALHEAAPGSAATVAGANLWHDRAQPSASRLAELLRGVVREDRVRIGLVVEGAPRLTAVPDEEEQHDLYVTAHYLSRTASRRRLATDNRAGLYNTVLWTVDRESDLPHWLVGATGVRVVSVPEPTMDVRRRAAQLISPALPGFASLDDEQKVQVHDRLAEATEGMTLVGLTAAVPVAIDRGITADRVEDSVRFLRSGLQSSPWREPGIRERIGKAATDLNEQVLGQERAVRKVVDVLARSALGLSGAQSSGHPTRPQGVLFLAGPTGVGKTELAKQITKTIFGRPEAMIRFDMSEFAADHTEARMLGAPPGYVGHDAGGELTNAVRRRPFCLLLFDEIEKANPRILDKFLQILEDGRLTDGSGSTVHFTETLIVFTSNLGIYQNDEQGRPRATVEPGTPYEQVEGRVREAIRGEFLRIGRPEILNRIGDNIVVFDFITPEAACLLLRRNLANVAREVRERTGSTIRFEPVLGRLDEEVRRPQHLAFGGRAVGSVVESMVLNPLARELLVTDPGDYEVDRLWSDPGGAHLTLTRARG